VGAIFTEGPHRQAFMLVIACCCLGMLLMTCAQRRNAPASPTTLAVCAALDQSLKLRGGKVVVRGFLSGSASHGYSLHDQVSGCIDPCSGWNARYFTAPAILELTISSLVNPSARQNIESILHTMRQRENKGDVRPMCVEVYGYLRRKTLLFIVRNRDGAYIGNGYGQGGGRAALLELLSMHEVAM
jgi:hypothetical protein